MPHYVALLRGINVGGHRVKMTELCARFAQLGLTNVTSFIASGNVRFDTDRADVAALEAEIAAHLHTGLGYAVPTFLRTPDELRQIVAACPFAAPGDETAQTVHVALLHAPLDPARSAALVALETSYDAFSVCGREFYWRCNGRSSDTLVKTPLLNRAIGAPTTMRNIVMLRKLIVALGG